MGYIQTFCALIVVFSYYIEYRANIKYIIEKGKDSSMEAIEEYGKVKGSQGYGKRKANKMNVQGALGMSSNIKIAKQNMFVKMVYFLAKEFYQFIQACYYDKLHTRNLIYLIISILGSRNDGNLFNALLLIDIINKIKTLSQVLSIFNENKIALASTLLLFAVLLYISSFIAFERFRTDFESAESPDDDNAPDFNLYCDTLVKCFSSTVNFGIRAGGGIGDVIAKPMYGDDVYWTRYVYDFLFFMVINIILMNIFFGIIIDSFAEKRAGEAEI